MNDEPLPTEQPIVPEDPDATTDDLPKPPPEAPPVEPDVQNWVTRWLLIL